MKRVFIFSSYPLFGGCVESLLNNDEELSIVGREKELTRAISQVRALEPDVIVIDSNDYEASRALAMSCILKEGLQPRIIGLNVRDNKFFVCKSEQGTFGELKDFLETVKSEKDLTSALPPSAFLQPGVGVRDRFGRTLDYLRVSVTDRCNLRCVHCMPPEGMPAKPRDAILHSEEIARIVEAAAGIGFRKIRLTGGEPLVRKNIVGLVRRLAGIRGVAQVSMTTNATLLNTRAKELAYAGLKGVNISLCSLRAERFRRITRVGNFESVWQGIQAAEAADLTPLKLNMVVLRGFNDDEVVDFARLTLTHPWHIRFIEAQPVAGILDQGRGTPAADRLVPGAEIFNQLQVLGTWAPNAGPSGHGPARYYRLPNAQGTVGFINAVSEPFCHACNRIGLTADGYLRPCFFSDKGIYGKAALADGANLGELQTLIRQTAQIKPDQYAWHASDSVKRSVTSLIDE